MAMHVSAVPFPAYFFQNSMNFRSPIEDDFEEKSRFSDLFKVEIAHVSL